MHLHEFLRKVPKVELHCHVEGTVRASTVAHLARRHGIALRCDDPSSLYDYKTIYEFLAIFALVSSTVIDRDDFARVSYESLEDGVTLGNLRCREMFFNPTLHTRRGLSMTTVVDGLIDGIRDAERDFGVRCRLIADIYRQDEPIVALQMVEELLALDRPEIIGLGMDGAEAPDPPEKFVEAYALARKGGLRLTSHACEDAPAQNVVTCLDILGCERIDHGYHVLGSQEVTRRCRDEGIYFTCCPTSTGVVYGWPDLGAHPIKDMVNAGLRVTINSDDPTMFRTDIAKEYVDLCDAVEYGPAQMRRFVLDGVEAAWLDDGDKRSLRHSFSQELDRLESQLGPLV
ncbi:MAG: adenosine deaminase [Gallionella sp.]|jgi:adenosine deaminase|nr:adenosine deaminase [Gallionella sp.]